MNEHLLVSVDNSHSGYHIDERNIHRWSFVYAHGIMEEEWMFDIVLFNQEEPTEEGYYIATSDNNRAVLVHLVADERGIMRGRCCYIDDYEALKHVNSPQDWM